MNPSKPVVRMNREQAVNTAQKTNRTFICSVLFIDIVEYSKKRIVDQVMLKEQFNRLLFEALENIPINDRIVIDTGDGAAIGFLGDPEEALFVAMGIRDSMVANQSESYSPLSMRMGINLGPVKLITDINKQINLIGDGINVAQRIMGFAEPEQLLVSRSYFEVISCLSDEYAKLFKYHGLHADKHVREHEVYTVGWYDRSEKALMDTRRLRRGSFAFSETTARRDFAKMFRFAFTRQSKTDLADAATAPMWSMQRLLFMAVPVALVVIVVAFLLMHGNDNRSDISKPEVSKTQTHSQSVNHLLATTGEYKEAESRSVGSVKVIKTLDEKSQLSSLGFRILPWGEIYIDGKQKGVCPPVTSVKLKPGRHEIEIRNTSFAVYRTTIEIRDNGKTANHTRVQIGRHGRQWQI